MVTIVLELDQATERRARAAGLLDGATISAWIEAELERKRDDAINQTRAILEQLDALEPKLTEEEIAEELRKPSSK